MDEQRLEAYFHLINALLTCPGGEEPEILDSHQNLIDEGLVQTMKQVAAELAEEDDQDAAEWLRDVAAELAAVIGNSKAVATPEEYLDLLIEVLLATEESNADPQVVYPLLETNLDKLDGNFAIVLRDWATATLLEAEPEEAYSIAAAVGNFSILIQQFALENQTSHIKIAITGYEVVTTVITREVSPEEWAMIQNYLGLAYLNRIDGDLGQNLESAIAAFQAALQVRTRKALPKEWAETQNHLGNVYWNRIHGNQVENLEAAIAAFQAALQVYTHEGSPLKWAMLQDELGNAYCDRIRGDWVQNQEAAIAAFQAALQVYTHETFPEDWARTQNNLATIYSERTRGDKAENLELAIKACENALQVYTRKVYPEDWAMALTNLGAAYRLRVRGDQAENLEQTIQCYKAALEEHSRERFPEDWAGLQNNLGNVYRERIRGNRAENLEQTLRCFNGALEVYTRESFPQDWAMIQNNLALTYCESGQTDEAIACFRAALEICTPTTFPVDCLHYGGELGDKAFAAGCWAEAIEGYGVAIEVIEQTRAWVSTEARRQEILKEDIDVYENMVQACVNNGQLDKAVEYVERSRSRRLVDLMASNDLYTGGEIPQKVQEYLQQFEAIQQQIDQERFGNKDSGNKHKLMGVGVSSRDRSGRETSNRDCFASLFAQPGALAAKENRAALEAFNETLTALEAEKQQVWQKLRQLDPVLAGQIQVSPLNKAAIQQLIDRPNTAILSFYTTSNDTYIFVLRQNQITCYICPGQGQKTLQDWIEQNWLKPYLASCDSAKPTHEREQLRAVWISRITPFLMELAQRLQLNDLIAQHLTDIEELILVPHLYLHSFPFAALPIGDSQYLGDRFLIRYIPSCQVLEFCQKRPLVDGKLTYGIVEDATEDLPCASFEGEQIAQLYNIPNQQRLQGRSQATVSNYRQLAKQVQAIVSSHHAQTRLDNPLESRLELGNGSITLGQLMTPGWRLPHLSDVFLSCCETGLGVTEITDDILTLSTGFLCAGARSVVSTLWAVDDLGTALFSIFYHQHRQQGYSPSGSQSPTEGNPPAALSHRPTAVQQAQVDLRTLTGEGLATRYQPQLAELLERKFEVAESDRQEAEDKLNEYPEGSAEYLVWKEKHEKFAKVATRIYNVLKRLESLCCEDFPFSHPFYWAAFTCSGLR